MSTPGSGQLTFDGFELAPPPAPRDASALTRSQVDALRTAAERQDALAGKLKAMKLKPPLAAIAHRLLHTVLPGSERTWLEVALDACGRYGVSLEELLADGHHTGPLKEAREEVFWFLRLRTFRSFKQIGAPFGVHPTTVSAACKAFERRRGEGAKAG
jgi:chromosomal replication initiation ATPase DnaA